MWLQFGCALFAVTVYLLHFLVSFLLRYVVLYYGRGNKRE